MWGVRVGSAGGAVLVLLSVALLLLPGTLLSTGGSAQLATALPPGNFNVNFQATNYPGNKIPWTVTLAGSPQTKSSSSIQFVEPNGTYNYTISSGSSQWQTSPTAGQVTVNGTDVTVPVDFIQVNYTVTFTESGLKPAGTEWWVNVTTTGQSFHNGTTTVSFSEPNGTNYQYTIASANKNYAAPGGTFTVSGQPVSQSVTFSLQSYTVTFTESGLKPAGTEWWVNVTTTGQSFHNGTTTVSFSEPNGTYQYTIGTTNKLYAASGSTFTVSGRPVSQSVTFLLQVYTVTFTESGLPGGTVWWVNLTSGASSTSAGTIVTFSLANGSYSYHLASADKRYSPSPPGNFAVSGGPMAESVSFSKEVYVLQFYEGGLPAGTKWTVALSGPSIAPENQSSTLPYIDFNVLNGTYNFSVKGVAGYGAYPSDAQVVVAGNVSVSIAFSTSVFEVLFAEQGLPAGTPWGITIGVRYTSNQPTINVSLPNGSYTFAVDRVVGYYTTFSTGSFRVSGANQIVNVTFVPYAFPVEFSASGLPATENWTVTLGNVTSSASGDATILFLVPNGTYPFQVNDLLLYLPDSGTDPGSCGGNVTLPAGNVSVCGRATTLPVIFYPVPAWPVTFVETGLGQGVAWSVAIGGHISYGSSSTLIVDVPNGTYSYSLGAVPGYSAASNSGMIHMTGSALQVNVSFTRSGPSTGGPPTGLTETEWVELAAGVVVAALIAATVVVGRRRPGDRNQP